MTNLSSKSCWTLASDHAALRLPNFSATVSLLNADQGLGNIGYADATADGYVLGIALEKYPIDSADELADVFVRGSDLVVTYAQTDERPFDLQVYWRAELLDDRVVQLDAILSLQTCLLESFPSMDITSSLPAGAASVFSAASAEFRPLQDARAEVGKDSVLLRPTDADWSYAQRIHPEDRGECQVNMGADQASVTHHVGGQFLEKGVIRRLRLRGLFLPRENDIEKAVGPLFNLETEVPPLTV